MGNEEYTNNNILDGQQNMNIEKEKEGIMVDNDYEMVYSNNGKKYTKWSILVKLMKCLMIMEMCNCHSLYQIARGHYAFPMGMYNRMVVQQILMVEVAMTVSITLSLNLTN